MQVCGEIQIDVPERTHTNNNIEKRVRRSQPEPEPECHPSLRKNGKCPTGNQKKGNDAASLKAHVSFITVTAFIGWCIVKPN